MYMKWISRKSKAPINQNDSALEKVAKIRGIKDIKRFLYPTKEEMFNPYLLKNIEDACNRILLAIKKGEKILISMDCDADGVTSGVTMHRYLNNYTDKVDYIYGERNYGHGIYEQTRLDFVSDSDKDSDGEIINEEKRERFNLNTDNIRKIRECDLLILIDSSSNDTEACRIIAEEMGKDIIILDHHAIERENPYAILVNPQQKGDEYPNKQLSGAGVVFKVLQVMEDTLGQVDPFRYMDLVAVGMYADVMRVDVLENRFMIMYGLRNIKNVGILRILKGGKVDLYKINCDAIGFTIAPLINGSARMGELKLAIDILLTDDDNEAKKLRLKMQKLNNQRKEIQKEIVKQYMTKVNSKEKVLIVIDEQSSRGFNGVVAQQLSDIYKRPAIVGRLYKGVISGSFRSYNGFNLQEFLSDSQLLEESMGHPQAGGFVLEESKMNDLTKYIDDNLPELNEEEAFILYDFEINADEVKDYIKEIEQLNLLTGNGFPKVTVKINSITIDNISCIGETQETIKIKTFDDLELIKFKVNKDYASELGVFDNINAVGKLSINEFYNFKLREKKITNQLIVDDYSIV